MILHGLNINFLGDSITEGCGTVDMANRFTNRIALNTGAACRNYGIGGTRIALQHTPSVEPIWDRDFCTRVYEMDRDADVVVVFGGTNDYGHGDAPFGTDSDRTADTFCGALHVLYTSLGEAFPKSKIVILTPLHRHGEDNPYGDGCKQVPTHPLADYVAQIRKTAEDYGYPILDLFETSELNPNLPGVTERYVPDGLHPNDAGHALLAQQIVRFLQDL